ncbi:MAG: hypothetical protein IJ566_05410 [Cardiobacteriaceae bacterium]|nr:hypothetical protein [Cardiobacteriaceae bacterium]
MEINKQKFIDFIKLNLWLISILFASIIALYIFSPIIIKYFSDYANNVVEPIVIWVEFLTIIYAWCLYYRRQQKIKIILEIDNKNYVLPVSILRMHFTRSELLGILQIYNRKDTNNATFEIQHLATDNFFADLQLVQLGKNQEIRIPITKNDNYRYKLKNEPVQAS